MYIHIYTYTRTHTHHLVSPRSVRELLGLRGDCGHREQHRHRDGRPAVALAAAAHLLRAEPQAGGPSDSWFLPSRLRGQLTSGGAKLPPPKSVATPAPWAVTPSRPGPARKANKTTANKQQTNNT